MVYIYILFCMAVKHVLLLWGKNINDMLILFPMLGIHHVVVGWFSYILDKLMAQNLYKYQYQAAV
jgi:hypothetical protein